MYSNLKRNFPPIPSTHAPLVVRSRRVRTGFEALADDAVTKIKNMIEKIDFMVAPLFCVGSTESFEFIGGASQTKKPRETG